MGLGRGNWKLITITVGEFMGDPLTAWNVEPSLNQRAYCDTAAKLKLREPILRSVLIGEPIGPFHLVDKYREQTGKTGKYRGQMGKYWIEDANHRRTHLIEFVQNRVSIEWEGKTVYFRDLSLSDRKNLLEYELHIYVYFNATAEERARLFRQLNSGIPLSVYEVMNAYMNDAMNIIRITTGLGERWEGEDEYKIPEIFDELPLKRKQRHPLWADFESGEWYHTASLKNRIDFASKMFMVFCKKNDPNNDSSIYSAYSMSMNDQGVLRLLRSKNDGPGYWQMIQNREDGLSKKILTEYYDFLDELNKVLRAAPKGRKDFTTPIMIEGIAMFMLGIENWQEKKIGKLIKDYGLFASSFIEAHEYMRENPEEDTKYFAYTKACGRKNEEEWKLKNDILREYFSENYNNFDHKVCGINLVNKGQKRFFTRAVKMRVLRNQGNVCSGCEKPLTLDESHAHHIIPVVVGGDTVESNCEMLHQTCHMVKHLGL
jgi:hypothetical protein